MPYVNSETRDKLQAGRVPSTPGELNYAMSQLVKGYLAEKGVCYTAFNDIIGVLSCLSLEVYRRLAAPYEDKKMSENGDVW